MNFASLIGRAIYYALQPTELNQGEQEMLDRYDQEHPQEPIAHIYDYNENSQQSHDDPGTSHDSPSVSDFGGE